MILAVIDDSPDARATLANLLKNQFPFAEIHEADGVQSGLQLIRKIKPEVIFLDVMMTDGTGFDLLAKIPHPDFKIVFVSGYDTFAVRAFKFSAVDYLVKPVVESELIETITRLSRALTQQGLNLMLQALQFNNDQSRKKKQLILRDTDNVYAIDVDDIVRCQSDDNYTTFYTINQKPIMVTRSLKEFDEMLEGFNFFRVHQSHLINLNFLAKFQRKEGGFAILKDGTEIPVATRKREPLLEKLSSR